MRSRLLLGGLAAGFVLSLVPQASAEPINCHHIQSICKTINDLFSS
jgi:hypothetical protein